MANRVHQSLFLATNWLHLALCKPALCHLCEYLSAWGQLQAPRLKGGSFPFTDQHSSNFFPRGRESKTENRKSFHVVLSQSHSWIEFGPFALTKGAGAVSKERPRVDVSLGQRSSLSLRPLPVPELPRPMNAVIVQNSSSHVDTSVASLRRTQPNGLERPSIRADVSNERRMK